MRLRRLVQSLPDHGALLGEFGCGTNATHVAARPFEFDGNDLAQMPADHYHDPVRQQDCFIEINPQDASARGIKDGAWVWVSGAENNSKAKVKALVTERVGKGVAWMPFHFAGWYQGVDQRGNYPKGADPIVLGESVNTLTTYGYDPVTGMQEPKATLCQIAAA